MSFSSFIILLLQYMNMRCLGFLLCVLILPAITFGQGRQPQRGSSGGERDSSVQVVQREKSPIIDYKIISVTNDTTFVDTTLTIQEDYQFNYLRRDRFEYLPFSNVGQTYNRLSYDFQRTNLIPEFGARARHFNFFEVEDVAYYRVPTPFTELFFRTVFEQGQILDALFTVNTSPNLNFSVAYKGLRSLGKYQHLLTSTGNFRTTVNYHTPNRKYQLKAHFVSQDLMNQENGGLTPLSLQQYLAEEDEIQDRARLDVNFEDAQSTLFGKRFYLNHLYHFRSPEASSSFSIGHKLNFSNKEYLFEQSTASRLFGPSYESVNLRDETELEHIYNEVFFDFKNRVVGDVRLKGGLTNYNYGYNSTLILDDGKINNRLIGNIFSAGGDYSRNFGNFSFYANGMVNISEDFEGNNLLVGLRYDFSEETRTFISVRTNSRKPNFNFLLYQSDYVNYNWQNDFSNISTQKVSFAVLSPKWFNVNLDYSRIKNYTFFGLDNESFVRPMQYDASVRYVRAKIQKEVVFGKFALNNTLLYQNVLNGGQVLNVPNFITRNSLYYQDHWFQRALYLQTGLTFNYFTNYYMDGYDPVLAEFYVQNEQVMDGFPRVDFFFNSKIRQARVFFKLEQVHTLLTGNNDFSAPLYPYRDFGVRFGLIWNFFL